MGSREKIKQHETDLSYEQFSNKHEKEDETLIIHTRKEE